jgi:Nucleotide modification associated domain 2
MLYSYRIPVDDGAAPNPYWGTCTLAICKPKIRKAAVVGDWVIATGSTNAPKRRGLGTRDLNSKVVYAMLVTAKLTMANYDRYCKETLKGKVPDWNNRDCRRRLGDSIYDFSAGSGQPMMRQPAVHDADNMKTDLSGGYVLLSDHFYYFGDRPIDLPDELRPIIKQGQGHKSWANMSYEARFVEWLEEIGLKANTLYGKPQIDLCHSPEAASACASTRRANDEREELVTES